MGSRPGRAGLRRLLCGTLTARREHDGARERGKAIPLRRVRPLAGHEEPHPGRPSRPDDPAIPRPAPPPRRAARRGLYARRDHGARLVRRRRLRRRAQPGGPDAPPRPRRRSPRPALHPHGLPPTRSSPFGQDSRPTPGDDRACTAPDLRDHDSTSDVDGTDSRGTALMWAARAPEVEGRPTMPAQHCTGDMAFGTKGLTRFPRVGSGDAMGQIRPRSHAASRMHGSPPGN